MKLLDLSRNFCSASLAFSPGDGNQLLLTDNTNGSGAFRILDIGSTAGSDLAVTSAAAGNVITAKGGSPVQASPWFINGV